MITLGEYITEKFKISKEIEVDKEQTTEKDLKDAVKKTGFKLNASFKFDPGLISLRYMTKGGYAAGDKINNFIDTLKDLDWKELESKDKISQMNGSVDYVGTLYSPNKELLFKYSTYYGSTSRDNVFNAEFLFVEDEEETLTKKQNLQNMEKTLKEFGVNYPNINDFKDLKTFRIGNHIFSKDLEKVKSSWKKVDENTYEKDNFVFTIIPAEKAWDTEYYLSFKNEPEKVKIIK